MRYWLRVDELGFLFDEVGRVLELSRNEWRSVNTEVTKKTKIRRLN